MEISITTLSPQQAWEEQLQSHKKYHLQYKDFYKLEEFILPEPVLLDAFASAVLSEEKLKETEKYFKENIYDAKDLKICEERIKAEAIPFIEGKLLILQEIARSGGVVVPYKLNIVLSCGMGGFYDAENSSILLHPHSNHMEGYPQHCCHEFVHLCIEDGIINKNKVPHLMKERIVSKICSEALGFDDHNTVGNKSGDIYLTKPNIMRDLQGTVKKVMKYYTSKMLKKKFIETVKDL